MKRKHKKIQKPTRPEPPADPDARSVPLDGREWVREMITARVVPNEGVPCHRDRLVPSEYSECYHAWCQRLEAIRRAQAIRFEEDASYMGGEIPTLTIGDDGIIIATFRET